MISVNFTVTNLGREICV